MIVDRPGDQLLARARIPRDQYRDIAGRHLLDHGNHPANRCGVTDDPLESIGGVELAAQLHVLVTQQDRLCGTIHKIA